MSSGPVLAIRAEGGPITGVGHLARCLGLVEEWTRRRGDAVLVSHSVPEFWREKYGALCEICEPGERDLGADWLVVDGYDLDLPADRAEHQRTCRIDDFDASATAGEGADLVVDQNVGASRALYPSAGQVLAGGRYALLRSGLVRRDPALRMHPVSNLVLALGGSPTPPVVEVARAIAVHPRLRNLDVTFLDGSGDAYAAFARADIAVAAAGSVGRELCAFGVPSVVVAVADNQVPVRDRLHQVGVAQIAPFDAESVVDSVLGLCHAADRRVEMSWLGQCLIDGHGARRISCRLQSDLIRMRDAVPGDAELLFGWANDPTTRDASFSSSLIGWDEHRAWLADRLGRTDTASLMATTDVGDPIGLVRFDRRSGSDVEIGVVVAPDRRGQGLGGPMIEAGYRHWESRHPDGAVVARIKAGNVASIRSFVDADFDLEATEDPAVVKYVRAAHV